MKRKYKELAKRLAVLCFDEQSGVFDQKAFSGAVKSLKEVSCRNFGVLLKEFVAQLLKEYKSRKLLIEYEGEFSEAHKESIVGLDIFDKSGITVEEKNNPSLIAGVKVSFCDFILEDSIQCRLQQCFDQLKVAKLA